VQRTYLLPIEADWPVIDTDCLVVGSGIAGLFTAIKVGVYGHTTVLTKKSVRDCNTGLAQGGIAAAVHEADSPFLHLEDTLEAGDGLCEVNAVQVLVEEGPARVFELMAMGAHFDMRHGSIDLHREAAHSQARILHSADTTGETIRHALVERCQRESNIELAEDQFLIDIITEHNECVGAVIWDNSRSRLVVYRCRLLVLATGGCGQLYRYTTNPDIATGDGIAAGFRAGCQLRDMEFVQFHPTVLAMPGRQRFLISEACRGAGGILLNHQGERFMNGIHPRAELAPRDVVARAIWHQMQAQETDHIYLDLSGINQVAEHFPNIYQQCLSYGIDITRDPVPVAPAAHYMMGGIQTDLNGYTGVKRLYACGEAASTGVHGANRLASNSLLEGIVFGNKIAEEAPDWLRHPPVHDLQRLLQNTDYRCTSSEGEQKPAAVLEELQDLMWDQVGIIRHADDLQLALGSIERLKHELKPNPDDIAYYQCQNLLAIAALTTQAALWRQESRGAHYRKDFGQRDDRNWQQHITFSAKHRW